MLKQKTIPEGLVTVEYLTSRSVRDDLTGCVTWSGPKHKNGYGKVRLRNQEFLAHRASWVAAGRPLTEGMVLDHLCRNRACVNVDHLEEVSSRENTLRGISPVAMHLRLHQSGRCSHGHDLSKVGFHKQGKTKCCAQCGRDRVARYKASKSERVSA